jgi:hypothetical protein
MTKTVDASTLTPEEIEAAITHHCWKMGSYPYYIQDEITRYRRNPKCITVFDDGEGKLRAYTDGKG